MYDCCNMLMNADCLKIEWKVWWEYEVGCACFSLSSRKSPLRYAKVVHGCIKQMAILSSANVTIYKNRHCTLVSLNTSTKLLDTPAYKPLIKINLSLSHVWYPAQFPINSHSRQSDQVLIATYFGYLFTAPRQLHCAFKGAWWCIHVS